MAGLRTPSQTFSRKLNTAYDSFQAKYGLINSTENKRAFNRTVLTACSVQVEALDEDGKVERKADMFFKRTINKRNPLTMWIPPREALAVSIGELCP